MRFVDYFHYLYQHEYAPSDLLTSVEIETEKLVHQTVNCLVVYPAHFNPNNFPLILLQISLLFTCTPALNYLALHEFSWLSG